ncbi:hypothetical protein BH09BAC2_BH09BAC2_02450 [soil metagenome]
MRYLILLCLCGFTLILFAQNDTTIQKPSGQVDTIRIGGMIIVKKSGSPNGSVFIHNKRPLQKNSNVSTASLIIDLGFANWSDNTNYAQATAEQVLINRPGNTAISANDFKLKTGKSSNVNIWFFMQRLNVVKHYLNLKYGLGIEMNNYRFSEPLSFRNSGPVPYSTSGQIINHPFVFRDSISFSKNKLSADYITVPMMVNFNTIPNSTKNGLSFSIGVSAGYLYSSRNKQKSDERGKEKTKENFDIQKWKFSYIGEIGLGPVRLYGSYTPKSLFENSLNVKPYAIGVRLSNW